MQMEMYFATFNLLSMRAVVYNCTVVYNCMKKFKKFTYVMDAE